jgi:ubiquinone/menaquinone biosynthesis C-methylase UbiE
MISSSITQRVKTETTHNNWGYDKTLAEIYDLCWPENVINDLLFYKKFIENKNSVLELASGTGRLLLPYLKSGINIDGLDFSSEMLDICKNKLKSANLETNLFNQNMANFNCNKKYDSIILAYSAYTSLLDKPSAISCLKCIHSHLHENGTLLISLFIPSYEKTIEQKGHFILIKKIELEDDVSICIYDAATNDRIHQIKNSTYKYEFYKNNILFKTLQSSFKMRWYFKNEFEYLLKTLEFEVLEIYGDYSYDTLESYHSTMTFVAVKN